LLDDRLGRIVSEGDVEQDLADPGHGTGRAEFPDEQTDALVAQLGQPELLCDRPEPSMDLCDRLLSVVESPNRRD
jgi:hypothetical protein